MESSLLPIIETFCTTCVQFVWIVPTFCLLYALSCREITHCSDEIRFDGSFCRSLYTCILLNMWVILGVVHIMWGADSRAILNGVNGVMQWYQMNNYPACHVNCTQFSLPASSMSCCKEIQSSNSLFIAQ